MSAVRPAMGPENTINGSGLALARDTGSLDPEELHVRGDEASFNEGGYWGQNEFKNAYPGPPLVNTQTISKTFKPYNKFNTVTTMMEGISKGIVIRHSICKALAPSIRAAS